MKSKLWRITSLCSLLFLIFLMVQPVEAAVQLDPNELYFEKVLKGGYAEKEIIVSTDSESKVLAEVSVIGTIEEWVSIVPEKDFYISGASPLKFKVVVTPPKNVANGAYLGYITVYIPRTGDQITGFSNYPISLKVLVDVTDEIIREADVGEIKIIESEKGEPLIITVDVENKGNAVIEPVVRVDILSLAEKALKLETSSAEILPSKTGNIKVSVPTNDLAVNKYEAIVTVSLDDFLLKQESIKFNLRELGSILKQGTLDSLYVEPEAFKGSAVEVTAVFKNTGETAVFAKFEGSIYVDDKLVGSIESEEVEVGVDETASIVSYFTPDRSGTHQIVGRVVFDSEKTEIEETVVVVSETVTASMGWIFIIAMVALVGLLWWFKRSKKR